MNYARLHKKCCQHLHIFQNYRSPRNLLNWGVFLSYALGSVIFDKSFSMILSTDGFVCITINEEPPGQVLTAQGKTPGITMYSTKQATMYSEIHVRLPYITKCKYKFVSYCIQCVTQRNLQIHRKILLASPKCRNQMCDCTRGRGGGWSSSR